MFNLGFPIGGALIVAVAIVRGRQGLRHYRSGVMRAWFRTEFVIGRADSAPSRYS